MRKLQEQNNNLNKKQLEKRNDGSSNSCVYDEPKKDFENPLLKEAKANRERQIKAKKEEELRNAQKKANNRASNNTGQSNSGLSGVEFDTAQFDAQGTSKRQQIAQYANQTKTNFHQKPQ